MTPPGPEFSRPLALDAIGDDGARMTIEADAAERAALARRLGLLRLDRVSAELRLTPAEGGRLIRLAGTFSADLQQTCVVTLEPLQSTLRGTVERLYDATGEAPEDAADPDVDIEADDPPEPAAGGVIDLGAAVAEQLALDIDPFPRKPGAAFGGYSSETGDPAGTSDPGAAGPFAALAKLKKPPK